MQYKHPFASFAAKTKVTKNSQSAKEKKQEIERKKKNRGKEVSQASIPNG
jgi:hypothetical protein